MSGRSGSKHTGFSQARSDQEFSVGSHDGASPAETRPGMSPAARHTDLPDSGLRVDMPQSELDATPPADDAKPKAKRRRWPGRRAQTDDEPKTPGELLIEWWQQHPRGRIGAIAAAVGALVLLFLPSIIAHTPLFTYAVNRATEDVNGQVTVQSASLGWFSGVVLRNVEVTDAKNRPVASVPEVATDRSLLGFLMDSRNLGSFKLTEPKLTIEMRENGSNLQDVLAKYMTKKSSGPVDVEIKVTDGSVELRDVRVNQKWQIDNLQLHVSVPSDASRPTTIETSGKVADGRQPGEFKLSLSWGQKPLATGMAQTAPVDKLTLNAEGLSLSMFEPLLAQWWPGLRMSGRVWASKVECSWDGRVPGGRAELKGTLGADDLQVAARELGTDRPRLSKLRIKGKQAVWTAGVWHCEGVSAESDVGLLTIDGTMDLGASAEGRRAAALLRQQFDATGQIDLAGLAAMLPSTLRVRKQTQITSGKVEFKLSSRPSKDGMHWNGEIRSSDLAAINAGKKIASPQPIRVLFAVRDTADGLAVDTLECTSSFLTVKGSGSRRQGDATVNFHLDRLIQDTGGLLDLGNVRIAGEGSARASWNRQDDGRFNAAAQFQVDKFKWIIPDRLEWNEDHLTGRLNTAGRVDASGDRRLDKFDASLESAGELTKLTLAESAPGAAASGPMRFDLASRGQLARWQSRLGPWLGLTGWKFSGDYDLTSKAAYHGGVAELQDAKLGLSRLRIDGPSLQIIEPKAELSGTGRFRTTQSRVEIEVLKLISENCVAQLDQFHLAVPEKGPLSMAGRLYSEMYVQRLAEWLRVASDWRFPGGKLVHRVTVQQDGSTVSARFESRGDNLVAVHTASGQRHEGSLVVAGAGTGDSLDRSLRFDQVTLQSRTAKDELLQGKLTGKLAWVRGRPDLQLSGTIDPNMNEITKFLQARFGRYVQVSGRGAYPFEFRGAPLSADATGSAVFRWDAARFYGFQLGPADVKANYAGGLVQASPLVFTASDGRVQVVPSLRVLPGPAVLSLAPGRALEQININQEMCASALQYVSPMLANVMSASGRFSLDLEGCRIPLANASRGEIAGKFLVHDIQIQPGPSHLVQEIAKLLGRTAPIQLKRESVVPFRMVDGRVYHEQMDLVFSNVTIRTKGSVGIEDQSLALVVTIPLPEKWKNNAVAVSLFKNGVTVPVGGKLNAPRIDPNAVEQVIQQALKNAATDARNAVGQQLQDQLQQQINRVLPGASGAMPAGTTPAGTTPGTAVKKTPTVKPSKSPSLFK